MEVDFYKNTMTTKMSLDTFIKLGGKLENFPKTSYLTYSSDRRYYLKPISSIHQSGFNDYRKPLYEVEFENGECYKYAGIWIEAEITLKLDDIYFK